MQHSPRWLFNTLLLAVSLALAGASRCLGETFPTFGLSVDTPKGWQACQRNRENLAIAWIPTDSGSNPGKVITLDTGHPLEKTVQAATAAMAKELNGQISDEQINIDGEPAGRVIMTAKDEKLHPVEALVVFHGGLQYMLFAANNTGESAHDEVEKIRASWKWVAIKSPAESLDDRIWVALPKSRVRISVPRSAAFFPSKLDHPVVDVMISNREKGRSEAGIYAQIGPAGPIENFDAVTKNFTTGWNAAKKSTQPLEWVSVDADTHLVISNLVDAARSTPEKPAKVLWVLRQFEAGKIVLVNITVFTDDAKSIERYQAFAKDFAKSMKMAEVPVPAK